jgi:hypothetical protein
MGICKMVVDGSPRARKLHLASWGRRRDFEYAHRKGTAPGQRGLSTEPSSGPI